jgi:hypothetical protein
MKKLLIILMASLLTTSLFSQITSTKRIPPLLIGKVQGMDCNKYDSTYVFTYTDLKYSQLNEQKSFSLNEKDFNDFFSVIDKGFNEVPNDEVIIETPNDILYLKYTKVMGVVNLQITHFVNKNPEIMGLTKYLTKNMFLKIFGKK